MRKNIALLLGLILVFTMFSGCKGEEKKPEPTAQPVSISIIGPWEDCLAVEVIGREFTKKYPNCTVKYEYLQNFTDNLVPRLEQNSNIDMFFTNGINETSELKDYVLDFKNTADVDLSQTFEGLIKNATCVDGGVEKTYALPLGAEMRGLYVNNSLLNSLNIAVPTNQATLLEACAKLKENGYIPFNANPGSFAQHLLYPWICNLIANADNYEEAHAKVEAHEAGISEMFREPFEFLYTLVKNNYYDYKTVENNYGLYKDATDVAVARDFLNIKKSGEDYAFESGNGQTAFLTGPLSLKSVIDKTKEDYHCTIDYTFIPAPVGKDGGFVYLSPARSIALNKAGTNLEWSIKFINFLFTPENNERFAESFNVIPNTSSAFAYISKLYTVPSSRISEVGQVTFEKINFYSIITKNLNELSKANNPYSKAEDGTAKYMIEDKNGTYTDKDGKKFAMYPFEHYMEVMEKSLKGE